MTTVATVHEASCTAAIHAALAGKGLAPAEHLVDAAYVDAGLLVREPRGATASPWSARRARNPTWQTRSRAPSRRPFEVDWDAEQVALPPGQAVLGLEPAGRPTPAAYVSHVPQDRLRRLPGAAPVHARPSTAPAPEAAAAGGARGARGRAGAARDRGRAGAPTRGGPGSRARSRRACARSACAAAATAGWPGPTCSTWPPRPRSTSAASPPGSARSPVPPPAPPASPPSPPDPISPTVSAHYREGMRRPRQAWPGVSRDAASKRLPHDGPRKTGFRERP